MTDPTSSMSAAITTTSTTIMQISDFTATVVAPEGVLVGLGDVLVEGVSLRVAALVGDIVLEGMGDDSSTGGTNEVTLYCLPASGNSRKYYACALAEYDSDFV